MGGNAAAGTKRMTKSEHDQVCKRICELLSRYYGYVSPIKSIEEKKFFGDVDLIASKPTESDIVHDDKLIDYSLKIVTETTQEKKVGFGRKGQRTIFLVFEEQYQIDLFECEHVDAGIRLTMDYRFMAMIIMNMLLQFKILFRQRRFVILNETDAMPIVDYNNEEIVPVMLRILGLDLEEYNSGFATYQQAHIFLKKSPVFSRKWTKCDMLVGNTSIELQTLMELLNADSEVPDEPTVNCDTVQRVFPQSFAKFADNAKEAKRKRELKSRFSYVLVKSWNIKNIDESMPTDIELGKSMSAFLALPSAINYVMSDDVELLRETFTNFFQNGTVPSEIDD